MDFLARAFLPLVQRMGPRVSFELVRYGFYPRGGGEIVAGIEPAALRRVEVTSRGVRVRQYAEAYVAAIPLHVAQRELDAVGRRLNWAAEERLVRGLSNEDGPGNGLTLTVECEHVTEVFTGFGERGVSAEAVANGAVEEARAWLASEAAVGAHLADQLLLPMALVGGGALTTVSVTPHLRSNAAVIERFLGRRVATREVAGAVEVVVG